MLITNLNNKYIKVTSKYLDELIANPASFNKLEITAKIDCNGTPVIKVISSTNIPNAGWVVDLSEAVALDNTIYQLLVKNIASQKEFNVITTPIALSYISTNCTSPTNNCTLQTYSSYFVPLFRNQINAWFTANGISATVNVAFIDNKLVVTNVPSPFGFSVAAYNSSNTQPYLQSPFGYSNVDNNIYITDNALYIGSQFFGEDKIADGVYQINIKYLKVSNGGFISEGMCAFIDVDTKCKVATFIGESLDNGLTDDGTSALLYHYALTNGSNCGCNCDELCKVYNELLSILSNTTTNNSTSDCGC